MIRHGIFIIIAGILDFINQPGKGAALYYADSVLGAPSAYYEFDIHENLKKIVAYSFNPDIAYNATVPSSVRLLSWLDTRMNRQSPPRIERYLDKIDAPVVVKGVQYQFWNILHSRLWKLWPAILAGSRGFPKTPLDPKWRFIPTFCKRGMMGMAGHPENRLRTYSKTKITGR